MSSLGMREYQETLRALNSVAELFKHRQFHEFDRLFEGSQSGELRVEGVELPTEPDQLPTEPDQLPTDTCSTAIGNSDENGAVVSSSIVQSIPPPTWIRLKTGIISKLPALFGRAVVQSKRHPRRKPRKIVK
ncbi:hypothetical protein JG688_00016161 [Phytophthora aleatoria]|uniref:Uncharacterized protein n=1 Tax=Phytophthora aleatoria TaxID=2496075 RepID=A0A8J5LZ54_9STRA|nr:hypothetical protein JG688_00016161 [Phytophthora aleatoria]